MEIKIYHNSTFVNFTLGDTVKHVWTGDVAPNSDNIYKNLDDIYWIFNQCKPKDYPFRSLSVGDIVSICGKFFTVDSWGFSPLEVCYPKNPTYLERLLWIRLFRLLNNATYEEGVKAFNIEFDCLRYCRTVQDCRNF